MSFKDPAGPHSPPSPEILPDADIRRGERSLALLAVSHPTGYVLDPFIAPAVGRVLDSGAVFRRFGGGPDAPSTSAGIFPEAGPCSCPEV